MCQFSQDQLEERWKAIKKQIDIRVCNERREGGSRHLTFAVDRNGPLSILTYAEELPDNGVVWSAPVDKEQIVMFEPGLCEALGVVHLLVESDDGGDVIFPKVWDVGLRGVQRVT